MSKYNHVEFIKQDPVGEVNFIIGKVGRMLYESISTTTSNLVLMFFGGDWKESSIQRRAYSEPLSVQLN